MGSISTEKGSSVAGLAEGNLKNGKIFDGLPFPKTYHPSGKCDVEDLVAIVVENRSELSDSLYDHGALLFRGFHVHSVDDFSRVVEAFGWEELPYEGAANRVKRGHRVYTTSENPLHIFIPFHHEMALIKKLCTKVFFYCLEPSPEGGETSIARSDEVVRKMKEAVPEAMEKLRTVGIMPVHRTKSADMSADDTELDPNRKLWHRVLKTDDEEEARKRAMEKLSCTSVKFNEDGTADFIYGPLNPIHEYNGREVMFNTILGFVSSERDAYIYYGDGEPLPRDVSETYRELLEENSVDVGWEKGDVLLVDNLRVQHARRPGKPPRSIMLSVCK